MSEFSYSLAESALGNELSYLQHRVAKFRDQNFPGQTSLAAARKVGHEAEELRAAELLAVKGGLPEVHAAQREAADVLITLLGWCEASDNHVMDLVLDAHDKMTVNEQRKWQLNADGTAQHVKEAT